MAPNHLTVFLNLANLVSRDPARLEEADALYRQAISMRADYTQAYINRGDVLVRLNRTREAQRTYETALFYDNDNPDIYYNVSIGAHIRIHLKCFNACVILKSRRSFIIIGIKYLMHQASFVEREH